VTAVGDAPVPDRAALLRGRWLVALAFLAPAALRVLSYTDRILDRDETYWLASAMRMRAAGVPMYVAGWDTKPPAIFAFYRVALALVPDAPMLAAHVMAAALAGAACAVVAGSARRLAGPLAGLTAAGVFALLDSTGPVRALAANTEVVSYVPVAAIVAVAVFGRGRGLRFSFAAGALVAAAAVAKHPALVYGPLAWIAMLGAPFDARRAVRSLLAGVAGAAAFLAVVLGWLWIAGAWTDFVACIVTMGGNRAALGLAASGDVSYSRWGHVAAANPVAVVGVLVLCAAAARRGAQAARTALWVTGPLVLAGLAAALAGGFGFQHYLALAYPPIAVAAGAGVGCAVALVREGRPRRAAIAVLVVLAGWRAAADRIEQWHSRDWVGYDGAAVQAVAARVREIAGPSDTMFVWGIHPDLYVTCRRAPATRFIACGWLVGTYSGLPAPGRAEPFEFVAGSWDLLFRDLDEHPPAVVVDSVPAGVHGFGAFPVERFPRLAAWLAAHYVREDERPGGYVVWRRAGPR
jgi:hypothetical protein